MTTKSSNRHCGPDFIGVGPEKTGTSWIDRHLRDHEDVRLPPVKELRYFWEKKVFPGENFIDRLAKKKSWHRNQYRSYFSRRVRFLLHHPVQTLCVDRRRFVWDIRYIFYRHDDAWYLSCFDTDSCAVSGEISPQYFFLPAEQIESIYRLLPECKIIISLRRPTDWIWSFARMNIESGFLQEKYGTLDNYIDERIKTHRFSVALKRWTDLYPEKQTLIVFFDDLEKNPWKFYQEICTFLEIKPDENRRQMLAAKVNAGRNRSIPDNVVHKIEDGWKEDVLELSRMLPDLPPDWL